MRPLRDDELVRFGSIKFRRARLYADEMVEDEAIGFLRSNKVNVQSARELDFAGRGDSFHVSHALRTKRFLLTKDRDFLNDRKFPLNHIPGIIVIKANMTRVAEYATCLNLIVGFVVPYGEIRYGQKIEVTPARLSHHFRGADGQLVDEEFRLRDGKWYTSL
jgi:predicted nuclease of predicted toxin-antitoxin system